MHPVENKIDPEQQKDERPEQQPQVSQPEILHSDLASLVMELAFWGASDIHDLKWLDVPAGNISF